jgi:hypothetical protein
MTNPKPSRGALRALTLPRRRGLRLSPLEDGILGQRHKTRPLSGEGYLQSAEAAGGLPEADRG